MECLLLLFICFFGFLLPRTLFFILLSSFFRFLFRFCSCLSLTLATCRPADPESAHRDERPQPSVVGKACGLQGFVCLGRKPSPGTLTAHMEMPCANTHSLFFFSGEDSSALACRTTGILAAKQGRELGISLSRV